jgi:hypothetical protein
MTTAKSCVQTAYESAMVQAYGAIGNVRVNYRQPY